MRVEQLRNLDPELKIITSSERPVLERMFQYYLYDMSEHAGWPLGDDGLFAYQPDLLSPYWADGNHYPYFIVVREQIVGFCMVRHAPDNSRLWDMGQFFVLRAFRGNDIGTLSFQRAIQMHPGQWQVRVLAENVPAYHFWKSTIADVTQGNFEESSQQYNDLQMTFLTFKTDLRA